MHKSFKAKYHFHIQIFGTIQYKIMNLYLCQITTSWQIDGEKVETVTGFIFLGSKITADGDYSHEIKRHQLLERKPMTNLDSILQIRGITLRTKVHIVKAMVFPEVMYRCESWTIKKAKGQRLMFQNFGTGEDS